MKNMALAITLTVAVLVSLAGFAGCGPATAPAPAPTPKPVPVPSPAPSLAPAPAPSPLPAAPYKWPESLLIGSQAVNSASYAATASWTPLLSTATGMKARLLPEDNSNITARWLNTGEVDLVSHSLSSHATNTFEGRGDAATRDGGPFDARFVWTVMLAPWGIMVKGDSGIKTVYDLKPGLRVANYPTPAYQDFIKGVLAWAKVKNEDIQWVNVASFDAGVKAVQDGRADFTYISPTFPSVFEASSAPGGIRFLEFDASKDPQAAAKFAEFRGTLQYGVNDQGPNVAKGVKMFVAPSGYLAKGDKDASFMYNLVKWIDGNYDAIKDKNPMNPHLKIDVVRAVLDTSFIPVHEGTIRYLKEKGLWTAKDDKRQAFNLDLVNKYVKAYKEALAQADAQKVTVGPQNAEWMKLWGDYKKQLNLPVFKVIMDF